MYEVGEFKDSLTGILSGLDLNNVKDLNGKIERSARTMLRKAKIPEATGRQAVTLYAGVYDYASPSDVYGESVFDLRPQGNSRNFTDFVYREGMQKFDRNKKWALNGATVTFEYNKGVQILRIAQTRTTPRIILDQQNAITGWTAGGSASTPILDQTVFYDGNGSLRFTLTGSSTGTLTKTIQSQDLTDYEGVGVVFLAINTPSASLLTSSKIRLGSDASNYFEVTVTQGFLGAWTANEWTVVALDLSTATETGTVAITAVDYVQLSFAHTGTLTNFRVGGLWISLPYPYELIYGTSAIFLASGSLSKTIANDNDQIILNDDAYTIFQKETALNIQGGQSGGMTSALYQQLKEELKDMYSLFKADYPSQQQPLVDNWYYDESTNTEDFM